MEYIMIVAGISYLNNRIVITCVDSTVNYSFLQVGASVTAALQSLSDLGYEVTTVGSDGSTVTILATLATGSDGGVLVELADRLNTVVTINTPTGSETGTLTFIGDDYIQLTAANGDTIAIPVSAILSFT